MLLPFYVSGSTESTQLIVELNSSLEQKLVTYVVSVKSMVKILSIFFAFLEKMNFNMAHSYFQAPVISRNI